MTPAATLARLKVSYPLWTIRRVTSGDGYTAHRRGDRKRVYAPTLADLERQLGAERRDGQ